MLLKPVRVRFRRLEKALRPLLLWDAHWSLQLAVALAVRRRRPARVCLLRFWCVRCAGLAVWCCPWCSGRGAGAKPAASRSWHRWADWTRGVVRLCCLRCCLVGRLRGRCRPFLPCRRRGRDRAAACGIPATPSRASAGCVTSGRFAD